MDEIPQVQNAQNAQPESTQPIVQTPIAQASMDEPPREHGRLRKIFNVSSWFVFFTFLPVTVLILLSQNTIPGDLFYPIKRSMENVVLAAASVSPATRAAFRTDLTERRFSEAETLLLARKDTTGLDNFIEEVTKAELEISALSNQEAKKDVTEKLIEKIDKYQNKLVAIEVKTQEPTTIALSLPTKTQAPITSKKDENPTPTSVEKPSTVTAPQASLLPTRIKEMPIATPTLIPTRVNSPDIITSKPTQTATILEPTLEPTPTKALSYNPPQVATPVPSDVEESEEKDEIAKAIDDTQDKLDEIKKQLKEHGARERQREDRKGRSFEVRQDEDHRSDEDEDKEKKKNERH